MQQFEELRQKKRKVLLELYFPTPAEHTNVPAFQISDANNSLPQIVTVRPYESSGTVPEINFQTGSIRQIL